MAKVRKRMFFIIGPESSGNHITRYIFKSAGLVGSCGKVNHKTSRVYGGSRGTKFNLDAWICCNQSLKKIIGDYEGDLFTGKSCPRGRIKRVPILKWANRVEKEGYEIIWIIPIRTFYCNTKSKKRRKRMWKFRKYSVKNPYRKVEEDLRYILSKVLHHGGQFYFFPVSKLYKDPKYVTAELKELFGLKIPDSALNVIYDADKKYEDKLKKRQHEK